MNTHPKFNQAFHGCHIAGVTLLNISKDELSGGFFLTTSVGGFTFDLNDTWVEIANAIQGR
ncbi:TPA: hypothetical protein ACMDOZ_002152 [Vibrio cholerae]